MKRVLFALATVVAALGAAGSASPAFACTIDPSFDPVASSQLVVVGRFVLASPAPGADPGAVTVPSFLQLEVQRVLKGSETRSFVLVQADLWTPGKPLMCPQFDSTNLLGREGVIALVRHDSGDYSTDRLRVLFNDDPRESPIAKRLARVAGAPGPPDTGNAGLAGKGGASAPASTVAVLALLAAGGAALAMSVRRRRPTGG